jgi:pimeloyl-ACP methyl ester carboxylesterase
MKNLIPFALGRYLNVMSILYPHHAASFGFRLFCYPFRSPLKRHQKKFLQTGERSVMQHQGIGVTIYRWGNGPKTILFLHGWQSHSFRWKNYIEQFSPAEYTLYALDAPGHGMSTGSFLTVPLYSEVIEKFIHEKGPVDAVVSHSLGSFTLLYTLHRLPLLPVNRVVLLASPGEATEFIAFYKSTLKLGDRCVKQILGHFQDVIQEPVEFFSAAKFAESLNRPGLIIHDEDDDETPYQHSVAIHKAWKKSSLILTKGLSHNLKGHQIITRVAAFVRNESEVMQQA